ncbi:hypothetical protein [Pseudonocardia sp. KRD291]|uniref:hypothetical protein n=1 Tax=Pseudonocardia sp. KRD291 TaxID=2792007 RepID=UPI001C4A66A3|nr:hypothetical protein [Pseudonocardia sp. KRD291]MBW0101513.1 LuxR family transcriptional regulator [Pseudonocardia sp. KRD291]
MGECEQTGQAVGPPARVRRLVPDLGDDLIAELARVEELLLTLAVWEEDDPDGPAVLPVPLAGRVALDALNRVQHLIAATQSRSHPSAAALPLLFGADGHYEHRPMRLVELDAGDLALLSAAAMCLGHTLAMAPGSELAEAIAAGAEASGGAFTTPPSGGELVEAFARVNGLLDLATTADTELLTARLQGTRGDVVLTPAEEEAYTRLADRMNMMWAGGSALDRWTY